MRNCYGYMVMPGSPLLWKQKVVVFDTHDKKREQTHCSRVYTVLEMTLA